MSPSFPRKRSLLLIAAVGILFLLLGVAWQVRATRAREALARAALSGGNTTIFDTTFNAFGHAAPGLPRDQELLFAVGNSFFTQNWVTAPASTTARDGLGPLFNERSCAACHLLDGRGQPPAEDGSATAGLLFRLSLPGDDSQGPQRVPGYGDQLQEHAVDGVPAEGRVTIRYELVRGTFADGMPYELRRPSYTLPDELGYGALDEATMLSPRVAPQMIGMGLLEALPEETILALADPGDSDGDGISGRPNYVWNLVEHRATLGRFGWKANQPTVEQQIAAAFVGDIGITNRLFPYPHCEEEQPECLAQPNGGEPEIDDDDLDKVTLYSSVLAVPARRDVGDPQVREGERLFSEAGCAACHAPTLVTGQHPTFDVLSNQTIHPYSDMLLHDMGPELADNRPDFEATGSEWRTPPLWGIGLIETVNGHTTLLHDGRARTLLEAILWHGGEAESARDFFLNLTPAQRDALIRFLKSL